MLTEPTLAAAVLDSVAFYHRTERWHCRLFLLMPDHVHALIVFPPDKIMSTVLGAWKSYVTKQHGVSWQRGYFDHRLRNADSYDAKATYIRQNPVVKNLCPTADDWPWYWPR